MIPLADNIPSERFPFVTYGFIALNVLIFFFEAALGPWLTPLIRTFGVVPRLITHGWMTHPWVLITLFTSQFLHAGWVHLFGNMLYLWIFGDNVEDAMGHLRFFFFYLFSGAVAGLVQVAVNPSSPIPTIGASGAVAGVLGAYFMLYPRARVLLGIPIFLFMEVIAVPAILVLGSWFFIQLLNGVAVITLASQVTGGVAWWAHIGGFVTGALGGPLLKQRRPRRITWYL